MKRFVKTKQDQVVWLYIFWTEKTKRREKKLIVVDHTRTQHFRTTQKNRSFSWSYCFSSLSCECVCLLQPIVIAQIRRFQLGDPVIVQKSHRNFENWDRRKNLTNRKKEKSKDESKNCIEITKNPIQTSRKRSWNKLNVNLINAFIARKKSRKEQWVKNLFDTICKWTSLVMKTLCYEQKKEK